eukprot:6173029-Amphidinium_carterae.1
MLQGYDVNIEPARLRHEHRCCQQCAGSTALGSPPVPRPMAASIVLVERAGTGRTHGSPSAAPKIKDGAP